MSEYLKIPEVARRLDVSEKTARRYIRRGELPSTFIGGAYRVSEEDLASYQKGAIVKPEELTARPKAQEAVSLERWLEERCGHSHLAMSFDELRRFIEDAEDLDEQLERRQLLREEIDVVVAERRRFPATERRNIGNVPFEEIHTRWIRTLLVSVKLRIVSPEEATREVEELALA